MLVRRKGDRSPYGYSSCPDPFPIATDTEKMPATVQNSCHRMHCYYYRKAGSSEETPQLIVLDGCFQWPRRLSSAAQASTVHYNDSRYHPAYSDCTFPWIYLSHSAFCEHGSGRRRGVFGRPFWVGHAGPSSLSDFKEMRLFPLFYLLLIQDAN